MVAKNTKLATCRNFGSASALPNKKPKIPTKNSDWVVWGGTDYNFRIPWNSNGRRGTLIDRRNIE
jgi:hypothetical protein